MTKQVFQLADAAPMSKPHVPSTREHPVFIPGHVPVRQPQGAAPQRGRPNAWHCQGTSKHKAPTQPKPAPKPRPKSWTREEAAALYPEFAVDTRVQLPFEFLTAAGPSTWIWATGEVTHRYRVTGEHQGLEIHVKWEPVTPTKRRGGEPSNSSWTQTVGRWSPCNCAPPTKGTSRAAHTAAKSTAHGPCHNPRTRITRRLQLRVSSTSSTPDGARAGDGPPPRPLVPRRQRQRKPTPASTSSTTTPPRPPTLQAMPGPQLQGADLLGFLEQPLHRADQPARGEQIPRPLAARNAPLPQDIRHGTRPPRPW